jgi:glycosyltransferase involved in cell wall biosynthesis
VRILDVSERVTFPPRDGATNRICHLLRHLSRDHEVRQFSLARFEHLRAGRCGREVRVTPSYVEYPYFHPAPAVAWTVSRRGALREPLLDWAGLRLCRPQRLRRWMAWADVVLVEYPWQFSYCYSRKRRAPVVLAMHNVEADNRISGARAAGARARPFWLENLIEIERAAVAAADLVLAVSDDDRAVFIDRYGAEPEQVVVISNGADTDRYAPVDPEEKQALKHRLGLGSGPMAIYLAGGRNAVRVAGLEWVRRAAARLPAVTFVVTGRLFAGRTQERNIVATGQVDDPLPYLQAADVSLCPVEFGGGTKIKVLESLAAGVPTVVFAEATRGLCVRHGDHVWVAEKDDDDLVAAIDRLLADEETASGLAAAGRAHVVAHHDWKKLGGRLEAALLALLASCESSRASASASSAEPARRAMPEADVHVS